MNPYLIIPLGWALGQMLFIVVMSVIDQQSKKTDLTFNQAFMIYVKRDTGPIYVAVLIMLIAMFLLPEIIAHASTPNSATEEIKQLKYVKRIVEFMRTFSVALGLTAQFLGFIAVSKAKKLKEKFDKPDNQ
jgi:hypothetical protein